MIRANLAWMVVLVALGVARPAFAQRGLSDIPDPDPELERRSFQVAEGFEVNLFAADPLIAKPIQMNWDAAGRLWLATSEVYPQIPPGQTANDKVVILEDTDGDGRADKTTVFADGLLIPTGVEPGDGGVYVANSTELLHLRDTDGDGRADARRVVLSGFGTEDTHHILHTLRWGPDGMLYFNQSIYIHSHIETPYGVRRLGGGGIWQFRPESMRLEVFARGFVNPWGHHFDDWGQSFATDGAYGEGINYVFPGATFFSATDAPRYVKGLNPGSPKHCGEEVLSGRHLPEDWRGNILTNDFRGNRVCRFVIREDGSGYASREETELIKTKHVAFRPVDIKMGPDGAIYIADWYNPIIQHGEVDFRDPRRDHTHGRIWRVTAKGRPLVERPRLVGAPTESLLEALKAPEYWTRLHAKRLLKERGAEVLPALAAWLRGLDLGDDRCEHHRLEALWTYQSLDVPDPELLSALVRSKDHRVRAAATRVLAQWRDRLPDPVGLLAVQATDDHPRVRLEAVRALGKIHTVRAADIAARALDRPMDRFLDFALWLTLRELELEWLPEVQRGTFDFGGNPRHEVFALEAVGSAAVVPPLVKLLDAGRVPDEREQAVLTVIAARGEPGELGLVARTALGDAAQPDARRVHLLAALVQAWQQRKVRPEGADLNRLARLLASDDDALSSVAARAAGAWRVEPLLPSLADLAAAPATSGPLRQAAIDGLALAGGDASRAALERLSAADHAAGVRMMAAAALASLDLPAGAARAVAVLAGARPGDDPSALFTSFLERQGGSAALAAALADCRLPADVAKIGVRLAGASGRKEPALIDALNQAGGLSAEPQRLSDDERAELVADVARLGDPARGEQVFRRTDLNCFKCHAIAAAGGQVGPDLVSIGGSAPVDYLVDSLIDPNKAVKEGYNSVVVATQDGKIITGIRVRQTDTELVLRNAEDQEVAIPLASIDEQKPGGSIMPAGLTETLTRGELVDLVRFLSELGKVGPYAVGKARVVRRWQVLEATPAAVDELTHTSFDAAATGDPRFQWSPAYSTVSGVLPADALPPIRIRYQQSSVGFARCRLVASSPGRVRLRVHPAAGVRAWLDAAGMESAEEMELDLSSGPHTLTFGFDLAQRREGLRCEIADVPGSAAQVEIVTGN